MDEKMDNSPTANADQSRVSQSASNHGNEGVIVRLVQWMRRVAIDPISGLRAARAPTTVATVMRAMRAREVLSVSTAQAAGRDFPSSASSGSREKQKKKASSEGMRKSRRLADLKLQEGIELHLSTPRARVGIGPAFQADVPEWTGPPAEADNSTLCYRGTTQSPKKVEQTISGSRRDDGISKSSNTIK